MQLERDDLSIDVARNGQEAILVTGDQPPSLVIMDVMMPRLNGFEATRFFKAKFDATYVPVLVLSAKDRPQDIANGAHFGCDDYMFKPYARRELVERVDLLLALSRAEAALQGQGEGSDPDVAPVIEARLEVAMRQLQSGNLGEVARGHLKRVLELKPDHAQALELLEQLKVTG